MAETSLTLSLPNLLSFFPPVLCNSARCNIHFSQLGAEFCQWMESTPLEQHLKESLKAVQMPLLVCYAYPDATLFQLQTCLDYLTLAFIFEEITDNASSVQSQSWANVYMAMYRHGGAPLPENGEVKHPVSVVMQGLACNVMTRLSPENHEDFIAENLVSVQAIVQEAIIREQSTSPTSVMEKQSIDGYYRQRAATVGLMPFLILAQWILSPRLPMELLNDSRLRSLMKKTVEMVFLANDIYSFRKERLEKSAENNILTVIMKDPSTRVSTGDIQGSIQYLCGLFRKALAEFHQHHGLMISDSSIPSNHLSAINHYCQALMDCAIGNIKWSLSCQRYGILYTAEEQSGEDIVVHV